MICPHCRANNAEQALRCVQCGIVFAVVDDMETVGPMVPPAPSRAPSVATAGAPTAAQPSTSAGVLSPPPGAVTPHTPATPSGLSWAQGSASLGLEPGREFGGRYRIEALLGEGGMGAVFKAYDKELDRRVALKLLRPGLVADADAVQRFKQELLLASKISHKNILRIHDLGDFAGIKFISMAFVEGEDLHRQLKANGRLPVERAVHVARQLCAALEAAHAEGVLHRDLKPQNVLMDAAGTAYVSDFGLAKSLDAGAAGMTRAGEFLGTPRYMSPEQVEGGKLDHRSDLYSLGLILYEMVTGDAPFQSDSTLQLMYQRVKTKPKSPKQLVPDLPDHLVRIIMRCLEKDPARRYQTAREILNDLEGPQAPAGSRTIHITLPTSPGRNWLWLAGAAVAVVVLVFALTIPAVRDRIFGRGPAPGPAAVAPQQARYLAVLPFRVLGDQQALGHVAEGLEAALSAKLFQSSELRVASAAAVERASAGKDGSLDKVARRLGVSLLVHGTVQGSGDRVRVVVNLEDVAGGKRLWSQEFSGLSQDLLTMEDQVHNQLAARLELKLSGEELARASAHPTENFAAYDLYLKGRTALRGQRDEKSIQAALKFFEDAVRQDAAFALAYAGLSDASLRMFRIRKETLWTAKALGAAQQAQRLNDSLPEVHFSLGSVYEATGKTAEAVAELRRALELAPNSDEGYQRLGKAYWASGLKAEAIQAYQRAIEVNPYYWVNHNALGNAHLRAGDNEKALAAFRKVTELEPENAAGYENIGLVYLRQGKWNECIPAFQKALSLQPYYSTYSNLGTAYFFLKRYDEAVGMFEKAVEINPNDELAAGNLADAYRWSGKLDKARTAYDKAIALAYKELQVNPRNATAMGSLALYYAKKGDDRKAQEFIRRARSVNRADVGLIYNHAVVHTLAGRAPEALKALREAFEKGYPAGEAKNDPELSSLHTRPEFQKMVVEFSQKSN